MRTIGIALATLTFSTGFAQSDVELAGQALDVYPYFQYVRSIGEDRAVEVAVDPLRHPELVDQTVDLYITAARSPVDWKGDPSLTDVRGAAQTETITGTTVQENTWTVAAAGQLANLPPIGLGIGYDVVIDVDQDGALSEGDLIDGRAEAAGFYAVHDTTQPGPLAVTIVEHSGGDWLDQRTYYPTDIESMGQLPLVVIGHGWTHGYTFYEHMGTHLASYGYIVTSISNEVGFGGSAATNTASLTVIHNTDYIIGEQATIAGGVLNGHLDSHTIVWTGHSTGGEAVVRAYTRMRQGFNTEHYTADDIVLVSSICPVAFQSPTSVNPFDVNYHMFASGADTDTSGAPLDNYQQCLTIYERATGNKQLTYVHGAGHNDFHAVEQNPFAAGPDLIGKEATNTLVKGYVLPLYELYCRDNLAGKDFFSRMYDDFHPIGIPPNVIVAHEYRDGEALGNFVIDDYTTNEALALSSSGGAVTYDVLNVKEVRMGDQDGSFSYTIFQPSNGMTRARHALDNPRCAVFDWTAPSFYELEVIAAERNLSDDEFLAFRVCQGTRHPHTIALDGPLDLSVTLRDGTGTTSTIATANYGVVTRPYQRTGFGGGAGWQNEFATIRLRLTDFLANGSGLDLADVVAVRFEFGAGFGSDRGRIGLDDVQITRPDPRAAAGVEICLPAGVPAHARPGTAVQVPVELITTNDEVVPGSPMLHVRRDASDPFDAIPLVHIDGLLYEANLPAGACGETIEMYFGAEGIASGVFLEPAHAPELVHHLAVQNLVTLLDEPLDVDPGWSRTGQWAFGAPSGSGGGTAGNPDPASGATGVNVFGVALGGDYATAQAPAEFLTLGPVDVTSLTGLSIAFERWLNCDSSNWVHVTVEASKNGVNWTEMWTNFESPFEGETRFEEGAWTHVDLDLSLVTDEASEAHVRWRHETVNNTFPMSGWNIDDVVMTAAAPCCNADVDGDQSVGFADLLVLLAAWGPCAGCVEDIDVDGVVGFVDVLILLASWGACA